MSVGGQSRSMPAGHLRLGGVLAGSHVEARRVARIGGSRRVRQERKLEKLEDGGQTVRICKERGADEECEGRSNSGG